MAHAEQGGDAAITAWWGEAAGQVAAVFLPG
jgi:hypothetical protein